METTPTRIDRATPSDASAIADLARTTFLDTFGGLFIGHEAELASYLDRTFSSAKLVSSFGRPANRYWLASDRAGAVGYAKLKLGSTHSLCEARHQAQLQKIYVLDRAIGTGLGRSLAGKVLEEAGDGGVDALWLSVHEANDRAQRFYARSGWRDVGTDVFAIGSLVFNYRIMVRDLRGGRSAA